MNRLNALALARKAARSSTPSPLPQRLAIGRAQRPARTPAKAAK